MRITRAMHDAARLSAQEPVRGGKAWARDPRPRRLSAAEREYKLQEARYVLQEDERRRREMIEAQKETDVAG